jgi:hypothetical protein
MMGFGVRKLFCKKESVPAALVFFVPSGFLASLRHGVERSWRGIGTLLEKSRDWVFVMSFAIPALMTGGCIPSA